MTAAVLMHRFCGNRVGVASISASPPASARRAPLALGFAVVGLLAVAVFAPLAFVPAGLAVVFGADARQRGVRHGFRAHRLAVAAITIGAVTIAVAVALTIVEFSA